MSQSDRMYVLSGRVAESANTFRQAVDNGKWADAATAQAALQKSLDESQDLLIDLDFTGHAREMFGVGAYRSPGWVSRAIGTGRPPRDYSRIKVPVLALSDAVDFDLSHLKPEQFQVRNDDDRAAVIAFGRATQAVFNRWSANLKRGVPSAKVIDMPGAGHYLWMTREADVLREIEAFIAGLAPPAR